MLDAVSTLVRQIFTADPAILDDPYAIYRELRSHASVVWAEVVEGGGSSLLTLRQRYPNLRLAEPEITWRRNLALRGPEKLLVLLR